MVSNYLGQVSFRPMGAYDAGVTYHWLDLVSYAHTAWVARREVRGVAPIEGEDWMQLVEGVAGPEGATGPEGPAGRDGSGVSILGSYPTLADLEAAHSSGSIGDAYLINGEMYIWDANGGAWLNVGTIQGPKGADGKDGAAGADGADGAQGPKGADGLTTSVNGVIQVDGEILLNAADIPTRNAGISVQEALDEKAALNHATRHAVGGGDEITPEAIEAAPQIHNHDAESITSGRLALARMPGEQTPLGLCITSAAGNFAIVESLSRNNSRFTGVLNADGGGLGVDPSASAANRITARSTLGLRILTGVVNITAAANSNGSANITFPAGTFTSAPSVLATPATVSARELQASTNGSAITGATICLGNNTANSVTNGVVWWAVQVL